MSTAYQKVQTLITDDSRSALRRYQDLVLGTRGIWYLIKYEVITTLLTGIPGALGLWLRQKSYPQLFKRAGSGLVFGRNITLRHAQKIELGDRVIVDDNCVLEARGRRNKGIKIGSDVIIGRNTILSCKDGDIVIGDNVGIGANTIIHAIGGNVVSVGNNVMAAPYVYLVGGSEYNTERTDIPIAQQGLKLKGGIWIENNVWECFHKPRLNSPL